MSTTAGLAAGGTAFAELAGPLRRELLAHCYRMLGSVDDAEDAVQETFLRAWRGFDGFAARASLRVWLYRIATNACLRTAEQRGRRALPAGLGGPESDPYAAAPVPDVQWMQPFATDPADTAAVRSHVRLAFVAALQHLPARQRAALLLRDVLRLPAAEVAAILDLSPTAVHSALRRARAHLQRLALRDDEITEPAEPDRRALLDRYVAAFHDADVAALGAVLRRDVALEMPPLAAWFAGRDAVTGFFAARVMRRPGGVRLVAVEANTRPGFAVYHRQADATYRAHAVQALTLAGEGIRHIVVFLEPELLVRFGLPATLPAPPS
jgi:RNA polymerase sigma-70 factor, ECF subfamily